jgi:hypothetical protein
MSYRLAAHETAATNLEITWIIVGAAVVITAMVLAYKIYYRNKAE